MTRDEYYDKLYDWAESTQIKKLSSVESLGAADEVAEVMLEFAFNHEDIVNRIARKAIEQKLVFSADSLIDLTNSIDPELQARLAIQSADKFSKEDLESLDGFLDADVLVKLYKLKGLKVPEILCDDEPEEDFYEEPIEKKPGGFFSALAMAFGMGHGISQGIHDATGSRPRKFRVGDHVRVRYRGQEGTVIDINGVEVSTLNKICLDLGINLYKFFSYQSKEIIYLSDDEKEIIEGIKHWGMKR